MSARLNHLPALLEGKPLELQDRLGGGWDVAVRPGEEVELSDSSRLSCLAVLQVERPHQIVLTPHVLGHQVDLKYVLD